MENTHRGWNLELSYRVFVFQLEKMRRTYRSFLQQHQCLDSIHHIHEEITEWLAGVTKNRDARLLNNISDQFAQETCSMQIDQCLRRCGVLFDVLKDRSGDVRKIQESIDGIVTCVSSLKHIERLVREDLEGLPMTATTALPETNEISVIRTHTELLAETRSESWSSGNFLKTSEKLTNLLQECLKRQDHKLFTEKQFLPRDAARKVFASHQSDVKNLYIYADVSSSQPDRETKANEFLRVIISSSGENEQDSDEQDNDEQDSDEQDSDDQSSEVEVDGADADFTEDLASADKEIGDESDSDDDDDDNEKIHGNFELADWLAILIWSHIKADTQIWRKFETMCFSDMPLSSVLDEEHFHFTGDELCSYFESDKTQAITNIYNSQFVLKPIVLRKYESVTYHSQARLPYVKEEELSAGEGSFGKVFKVRIAKGHLESRNSINKRDIPLARKDIKDNARALKGGKAEWQLTKGFVHQSVTQHVCIMQTISCLQVGDKLSLFLGYARCDLATYMKTRRSPRAPGASVEILNKFIGVASALEYLHNGIEIPGFDKVTCYHLDLKPENVLVVKDKSLGLLFKLTDFSISRIHVQGGALTKEQNVIATPSQLDDPEQSMRDEQTLSKLGHDSTCLSPECLAKESKVNSSSDVWAFGCLMSIFLAWLHGGKTAVKEFAELRRSKCEDSTERFFCLKPFEGGDQKEVIYVNKILKDDAEVTMEYRLNDAVIPWFNKIRAECTRDSVQSHMYKEVFALLGDKVLVIDPEARKTRMKQIYETLGLTVRDLRNMLKASEADGDEASPLPGYSSNNERSGLSPAYDTQQQLSEIDRGESVAQRETIQDNVVTLPNELPTTDLVIEHPTAPQASKPTEQHTMETGRRAKLARTLRNLSPKTIWGKITANRSRRPG